MPTLPLIAWIVIGAAAAALALLLLVEVKVVRPSEKSERAETYHFPKKRGKPSERFGTEIRPW